MQQRLFSAATGLSLCIMALFSRFTLPLAFLIASLSLAAFVDEFLFSKRPLDYWLKPLGLLGLCSYSVYLIHQPLICVFINELAALGLTHAAPQVILGAPVFAVVIFGLGWMMYVLIEQPGQEVSSYLHRHPGQLVSNLTFKNISGQL
jgi:peptidoglycan/LPS O-acetylase OafA/YrhL